MVDKKINFTLFILVVNWIHHLHEQLKLYIFHKLLLILFINFAEHSILFFLFLVLQLPLKDFLNAYPSLMYSLLLATGLASCPHTKPL